MLHFDRMLYFSSLENGLLAALAILSLWGFWRRFGAVVRRIRAAKPDADFQLFPLGPRIRNFAGEVLLQSKVVRERPLPGIAHALVFWGFCVFALVTLNHLATGMGFPFLSRDGFGKFYFSVAAVFGAGVSAEIGRAHV